MKNKAILSVIYILLSILIVLVFIKPELLISPGKVIDAHVEFSDDCFQCHTYFLGSTADKCISCHKVSEIGIKTTKGKDITHEKKNVAFHQELTANECVACHSDHKGVMVFRPTNQFSHEFLQASTQKHCDSCHENPDDGLHRYIKGNCGECHKQEAWIPATFEHDEYFVLDRDHNTDCDTCHISNNYASYSCYGCHEHSRAGVREEHIEEGIRDFEDCVKCHRSADEDEAERIWKNIKRRKGIVER